MNDSTEIYNNGDIKNDDDPFFVTPNVHGHIYTASCVFMAFVACFGIPANASIFVLFFNSPLIRTPFNYVLMNMVFAEFIIAAFGLPVDFTASFYHGWKMGKTLCHLTGFILTTTGEVSIITLAVLSLQRLLIITSPEKYKITSYKTSIMINLGIWCYTLFISIPPFFGFGAYVVETSGMTCAPDWESNDHIVYTVIWLFIGFLIPLSVIIYSSISTVIHMRKQTRITRSEVIKRMSQKREQKIAHLVIWMNMAFLVCWMPYGIICIFYMLGGRGYVTPTIVVIPLLAAKTSVCWNPLLYVAMNPQFRGAFKRFVKTRKEKDMELRWTRINQIDMNSDFSNLHINRFKRYYHRDSCNLARHRNFADSSAADGIREEYRQNNNLDGIREEYRQNNNLNNDFISKNDMISYGGTTSNSESHSDDVEEKFQSCRRSLPNNLHEIEMKADTMNQIKEIALSVVVLKNEEFNTSGEQLTVADVHVHHAESDDTIKGSFSSNSASSEDSHQKYMNIVLDPNRTSRTNGWIYGCYDPVKIINNNNENDSSNHVLLAMKPGTDLWNSLSIKSTDNLLNALNLIPYSKQSKCNTLVRYLQNEEMAFFDKECMIEAV